MYSQSMCIHITSLAKGGYVCGGVGSSVCLSACLSVHLFVCLSVCKPHYSKRIAMKFYGGVRCGTIKTSTFGGDLDLLR